MSADARVKQRGANAEAGSCGARQLRAARRRPVSAEGDKTSREAPDQYGALCVRQRDGHQKTFARRRGRDRADDARFVVGRRRASNVPIGSAGPHAAMARTSRRRLFFEKNVPEHDVAGDTRR